VDPGKNTVSEKGYIKYTPSLEGYRRPRSRGGGGKEGG